VDATRGESHNDAATVAYDGPRGYQPVGVGGAEQDAIVHDEFRDGHVPAGCGHVRVLEPGALAPAEDSRLVEGTVGAEFEYAIRAKLSERPTRPDARRAAADCGTRPGLARD
jgi:hypothetical protein